jgi:Zn-dependent protease
MPNAFKVARIGGIDIFVHWTWLLAFAFVTWSGGDFYQQQFKHWGPGTAYLVGAVSAILLFLTVLVHELAHSFTARAHALPVKTIYLFIFGGVSNLPQEPDNPRTELLVTVAGPAASLVLAGLFFLLYAVAQHGPSQVYAIFAYLGAVNLILALFNLIPGFPLDGGRVLRAIIWLITKNLRRATRIASSVGDAIGYCFILGGLIEAFLFGQVVSGIWLAFIGWFLHNAATATYQQAMVDRLLLGIDVRNVMDPAPFTAPPDLPIEALIYRHLLTENERAVPVIDPDRDLIGLVTLSDARKVPREEWSIVPISRIMTPVDALRTVMPGDTLREAMRVLAEHSVNQLPVISDGRLVGMLNRAHVVRYLHMRQQLEAAAASGRGPRL